jgi:HK97 family phage portal protein
MAILDKVSGLFNRAVSVRGLELGDTPTDKQPIFPEWFGNIPYGSPRDINIQEIRAFAKSSWIQMVLNTMKREISIIPYELINIDTNDMQTYDKEKLEVTKFFNKMSVNGEDIYDFISTGITDIGEIDAGVWVKQFSMDSYYIEDNAPVYDAQGMQISVERRLMLKPLGQRKLNSVQWADGGTIFIQTDIYRRLIAYFQYSFKNPRAYVRFDPEEIIYMNMNKRSYSSYGFSQIQAIQQVLELLIQSTRYNKDFFKNNAFPSGIITLPNASLESLQNFKDSWQKELKGQPHKIAIHNTAGDFKSFSIGQRDMEWLDGQKFYMHLVFGAYGLSPVEAGFHENVNQGNQAGQERVTVRNAIKPYLSVFEKAINNCLLKEILQREDVPFRIEFKPKDHAIEQIEFDQNMKEIEVGALTVNEYRRMNGLEDVEWGNEPSKPQMNSTNVQMQSQLKVDSDSKSQREKEEKMIPYSKAFEGFMRSTHDIITS